MNDNWEIGFWSRDNKTDNWEVLGWVPDALECLKILQKHLYKKTTDSNYDGLVAVNLLDQDIFCNGPDQKWGADISYIWTSEGWLGRKLKNFRGNPVPSLAKQFDILGAAPAWLSILKMSLRQNSSVQTTRRFLIGLPGASTSAAVMMPRASMP